MKKFLSLLLISMVCLQAYAIPAYPYPVTVTQPNGEEVTIIMRGDEFINWAITLDGYTLLVNSDRYWSYAQLNASGDLEPSSIIATEISNRSSEAITWLQKIGKDLFYSDEQVYYYMQLREIAHAENAKGFIQTAGERKLLVILTQFTDRPFTKTAEDFDMLLNQINYNESAATGSVKDFFLEASYNTVELKGTVVGPYTLPNNASFYTPDNRWITYARHTIVAAIDAGVDFNEFVTPGTNQVYSVYMIYAGYCQSNGFADAIWAHAQSSFNYNYGGYLFQRYACSSELRGVTGSIITDIGVICHEYGHSLGAPDYYDTNYQIGGQYDGTGYWDLMASGAHNNSGRSPAHPNPRTKVYTYNWATAIELNSPQKVTIPAARVYKNAYFRINTPDPNQYFIIENIVREGFNSHVPGQNLLIYRATDPYSGPPYQQNTTSWQRFYPVAANAPAYVPDAGTTSQSQYGSINSGSTTWPGTLNKTSFNDNTTPAMITWDYTPTNKPISNITVHGDYITFDFMGGGTKSNYHVFLPAYYGCIVTAQPGSNSPVNAGGSFSFKIDLLPSHNKSELVITANYEIINPTSGVYTISNIQADQIIRIEGLTFNTFPITVNAGENGSIIPNGEDGIVHVNHDANQTFEIKPDNGYSVDNVTVDGVDMGAIKTHTFKNVLAPHNINATFSLGGQYTINSSESVLYFETYAGVPSEPVEVIISSPNVVANIAVAAPSRFQVSHNGIAWNKGFTIARTQLPYKLYIRCYTHWGDSGTFNEILTLKSTEAYAEIALNGLIHLGIDEVDNQNIMIYPNPTTGKLTIAFDKLRVTSDELQIFDIVGKKVSSHHLTISSSHQELDISHLQTGIYFMQIQTENGTITKKVVKE
ncbi:MAG: M6 family metalloprotease domain-containing protein [Bacteroidetes bacterium]|nr:M6 family metalloprotease domain-containing protein [Bacteroidota bacterium]MCL2302104.1 M6 family metalloprotease domain-containing protein [Lentimicrobiaceae bacterium]